MLLDLAGVGGASQGSYLAAQIGSEIAGTGIQTVGGQERARAAGADGGRSCPACGGGGTRKQHRIYTPGMVAPSACCPSVPWGLQTQKLFWP